MTQHVKLTTAMIEKLYDLTRDYFLKYQMSCSIKRLMNETGFSLRQVDRAHETLIAAGRLVKNPRGQCRPTGFVLVEATGEIGAMTPQYHPLSGAEAEADELRESAEIGALRAKIEDLEGERARFETDPDHLDLRITVRDSWRAGLAVRKQRAALAERLTVSTDRLALEQEAKEGTSFVLGEIISENLKLLAALPLPETAERAEKSDAALWPTYELCEMLRYAKPGSVISAIFIAKTKNLTDKAALITFRRVRQAIEDADETEQLRSALRLIYAATQMGARKVEADRLAAYVEECVYALSGGVARLGLEEEDEDA